MTEERKPREMDVEILLGSSGYKPGEKILFREVIEGEPTVFFDELQWAELAKYKSLCEELAEALEKIENECACPTPELCYDYACEALANYRKQLGEEK